MTSIGTDLVIAGVALDGRDDAPLTLAQELARATGGRLALVHAYPYEPLALPTPEYEAELRTRATYGLEAVAHSLDPELAVIRAAAVSGGWAA